jgi:hypothetical protein
MNHIIWGSEAEIEEDASRFHRARLEDQGIPDFYDAAGIYRAIRPGEIDHHKDVVAPKEAAAPTPSFAVAMLPDRDLLHAVLGKFQDARLIDTLRLELASLANKVIVADRLVLDEPEALRFAVGKVAAYVNLGLEVLSRGSPKSAVKIIEKVFLEHLFRLAHTQVARFRGRLQRLIQSGWLSRWPAGIRCLDTDWLEEAELLLQQTPRLLRPGAGEDFFRERRDLSRTKHFLDVVSALGPLFEDLGGEKCGMSHSWWRHGQIRRLEDVTLGVMIWTAAAHSRSGGKWEVTPIKVQRWTELFGFLGPEAMERVIRARVEQTFPEARQRDLVWAYLNPLSQEYAREMAPFSTDHPPDPKLVKFFIFEDE